MSKVCSIIPQVTNSTGLVESNLFKTIQSSLPHKGRELRARTKSIYAAYHSNDFKSIVGDFKLYNSVLHNSMSSTEEAEFKTVYRGSLEYLKSTIVKSLIDDLNEPLMIKSSSENAHVTNEFSFVSEKSVVTFKSRESLDQFAESLGTDGASLINHIIGSKAIFIESESQYYSSKLNSVDSINYQLRSKSNLVTTSNDNVKFNLDNIIHNVDAASSAYSDAEIMYMNKIISALIIDDFDTFKDEIINNKDHLSNYQQNQKLIGIIRKNIKTYKESISKSLKDSIAEEKDPLVIKSVELKIANIERNYDDYVKALFTETTDGKISFLYKTLISHLRRNYGIEITTVDGTIDINTEDDEGNTISEEVSKAQWDDRKALSVNQVRNVAKDLKFKIAQCVSNKAVQNFTGTVNIHSRFGVNEPISINDVWNTCISIAAHTNDFNAIIKELRIVSKTEYNGLLDSFINDLASNKALWNSFFSSVCLVSIPNKTVAMSTTLGGKVLISDRINNYRAFAENVGYLGMQQAIQIKFENDPEYMSNVLSNKNTKTITEHMHDTTKTPDILIKEFNKNDANVLSAITTKIRWIETRLRNLGLDSNITMEDINNSIQSKYASQVEVIKNPFSKNAFTGLTNLESTMKEIAASNDPNKDVMLGQLQSLKNQYLSEITAIGSQLIYLTDKINFIKNEYRKVPRDKKSKYNFKARLDSGTALGILSYHARIRNYSNTNLGYMNADGNMEQTPQHPSYLTDIMKSITPINGVIDHERAIAYLTDKGYLSDRTFNNNSFLFNLYGNGLFNVVGVDKNGLQIIDKAKPINSEFVKNFKFSAFNGMLFKDTGVGSKYENITGDSWSIMEMTSALRGEWFIASSDSSRSHTVQMSKYGLKGFMFDEHGNFKSYREVLDVLDCMKNGIISPRKESDITDDSMIYTEVEIKSMKRSRKGELELVKQTIPVFKTLGDLKNEAHRKQDVLQDYSRVVVTMLNSIYGATRAMYDKDDHSIIKGHRDYSEIKELSAKNELYKIFKSEAVNKYYETREIESAEHGREIIRDILQKITIFDMKNSKNIIEDAIRVFNDMDFQSADSVIQFNNIVLDDPFYEFEHIGSLLQTIYGSEKIYAEAQSYITDYSKIIANDKKVINDYQNGFKKTPLYRSLRSTVQAEIDAMQLALSNVFEYEHAVTTNGVQYIKSMKAKESAQKDMEAGLMDAPTSYMKVKGVPKFMNNGLPTGQVFRFHRMSYNEGTKKITLDEYAKKFTKIPLVHIVASMNDISHPIQGENIVTEAVWETLTDAQKVGKMTFTERAKNIRKNAALFENIYENFIDTFIEENQKEFFNKLKGIADDLKTSVVDLVSGYVANSYEGDSYEAKRKAYLISMHDEYIQSEGTEEEMPSKEDDKNKITESQYRNTVAKKYKKSLVEAFLNNYLLSVNIGEDLLYGRQYEYKGFLDINKRANETFKNGKSNDSSETFTSMTIGDIETVSNMLNILSKNNNISEQFLKDKYMKPMEVGNGLSMITVDEYIKRLSALNMYEGKLKEYVEDLIDPKKKFNLEKYSYVSEQLKYFLYTRRIASHGSLKGTVRSYQEKNSTIILFPKLYEGTEFGTLAEWMSNKNINELNFLSGSKVGGQPVFNVHDTFESEVLGETKPTMYALKTREEDGKVVFDDRIDRNKPASLENTVDTNQYLVTYQYKDIRVQQDTVSHLVDEHNVNPTQMLKKSDVNIIDDEDYVVNGKPYKGRTHDSKNRGVFENRQYAMSYNALEDRDRLISMWGGMSNGTIQYDIHGNILLDEKLVMDSILKYYDNAYDVSLMRAFDSTGMEHNVMLSLNHPTIFRAIENLLQAKISNNVKQILRGVHGTIVPDIFMSPSTLKFGKSDGKVSNEDKIANELAMNNFADTSMISLSHEFRKQCIDKGKLELESQAFKDGKYQHAQIIMNPWDSQFDQYRDSNGNVDINKLSPEARTVVCTRIPHEGMQSSFVAEVVGFMNTGSSQIIVPKHLSVQTGWDYDIDSLYVFPRNLYERDGMLEPISYEYDSKNPDKAYNTHQTKLESFAKVYFNKEYSEIVDEGRMNAKMIRRDYMVQKRAPMMALKNAQVTKNKEALVNAKEQMAELIAAEQTELNENAKDTKDRLADFCTSKMVSNKFKELDELHQHTRETRDNMVIDSYISRITHPSSAEILNKPNEFTHSTKVSSGINSTFGMSNDSANFSNVLDRIRIANMNKDVAVLKASSVSNDNTMAIYGIVGATLEAENSIPVVITKSEFKTADEWDMKQALDKTVGIGNWIELDDRFIVFAKHMGNNADGSWTNVHGELITNQSSEITANILDAVKENLGHNINTNTLNILTMYANIPINHNTNLYQKDSSVRELNSFAYSNLIIHQSYVKEVMSQINLNKRSGQYGDKNNAMRTVKNNMYSYMFGVISNINITTGRYQQMNNLSIVDAVIDKLRRDAKDAGDKSEIALTNSKTIKKLGLWKDSIAKNEKINMSDVEGVTSDSVFNTIVEYLQDDEFETNIREFIINSFDENTGKQHIKNFENNHVIESLKQLVIDKISYSKLFGDEVVTVNNVKTKKFVYNEKSFKSIDELNSIYEDSIKKGYYDMNNFYDSINSIEVYKHSTSDILGFVGFLNEQLHIAKFYDHIDSVGNIISKSSQVLRTDKLGTSPNSSVSAKLFDDISNMYIDIQKVEKDFKDSGLTNQEISEFRSKYYTKTDIPGRLSIVQDYIDKVSLMRNAKGEVPYIKSNNETVWKVASIHEGYSIPKVKIGTREGKQLIEAIFPNVVDNTLGDDEFDFKRSVYPYFEAQYTYANHFSSKVFSGILFSENPNVKTMINNIISNLNLNKGLSSTKRDNITNRIVTTIINDHIFNEVPFFNGGDARAEYRAAEVLRVLGEVETLLSATNYQASTGRLIQSEISVGEEFESHPSVDTKVLSNENFTLENWKNLSAANQIYVLQNELDKINNRSNGNVTDINDIRKFLSIFEVSIQKDQLAYNGYHRISVKDNGIDISKMQQMFRKMYFNQNDFIRQTARDLIRYTFHTSGLRFGQNMSKYVDMSLYYEKYNDSTNTFITENNEPDSQRLYHYNMALKALENKFSTEVDSETINYYTSLIQSQMYDDATINANIKPSRKSGEPKFDTLLKVQNGMQVVNIEGRTFIGNGGKFSIDGEIVMVGSNGAIQWNEHNYRVFDNEYLPVIVEDSKAVSNSYYSNNQTIRTVLQKHPTFRKNGLTSFKRFDVPNSSKTYYFPFNKRLASEFTQTKEGTVIKKYGLLYNTEEFYKKAILAYDQGLVDNSEPVQHDATAFPFSRAISTDGRGTISPIGDYTSIITKSNESYTNTAKRIIDNVDYVLYIGSNDFYKGAFKSDKTIYTTLEELSSKTLDSIPFDKNTSLAIVGDTLSDGKHSQTEIDNIVINAVQNFKYLYPISSIKTIYKTGVGESVFKATSTSTQSNEYIEVGTKDVIHDMSAFSSSAMGANPITPSVFDISDVMKKESDQFTQMVRLYDSLKNTLGNKADTFSFDRQYMKSVLNEMSDVQSRYGALLKALEVNAEMLDKVVEFMMEDSVRFTGSEDKVSLFKLNILKYVSGDNVANKVTIANKLKAYNNIIKSVSYILDISPLTMPSILPEDYAHYTEEEKTNAEELKAFIIKFNSRLETIQNSQVLNSNKKPAITETQLLNLSKEEAGIIKGNYTRKNAIELFQKRIDNKIKEFFASQIVMNSRNPKFKNTNFQRIVDSIVNKNEEAGEIVIKELTIDDLTQLYQAMLTYNDDLTTSQLYLTSISDTGNSLIDNTMELFTEIRLNAIETQNDRMKEIKDIMNKLSAIPTIYSKDLTFDAARNEYFKRRYIDPQTGTFITKYHWKKFYQDVERINRTSKKYGALYNLITDSKSKGEATSEITVESINNQIKLTSGQSINTNVSFNSQYSKIRQRLIAYWKDGYGKGSNTANDAVINDLIANNEVHDPSFDTRYKYIKVYSYKVGDTTVDAIIRILPNGELMDKSTYSYSGENTILKYGSEYISGSEVEKRMAGPIRNAQEAQLSNHIATRIEIHEGTDDYETYLQDYIANDLANNDVLRFAYEQRYHIEFQQKNDKTRYPSLDGKVEQASFSKGKNLIPTENPAIFNVIPNEDYNNENYNGLENSEKEFITAISNYIHKVCKDVFPTKVFQEDFVPFIFMQQNASFGHHLKEFFGWRAIQKEHVDIDVFGNAQHFFQARSITAPDMKDLISIPRKTHEESHLAYEARILENANKVLERLKKNPAKASEYADFTEFTHVDQVYAYNAVVMQKYAEKNQSKLVYDIPSLLRDFTEEMYTLKSHVDFESTYSLMMNVLASDDFKTRALKANGSFFGDRIKKFMTGQQQYATKTGRETNTYKRASAFENVLYNQSRINTRFDQFLAIAHRFTSMNVMWFNYHTGIKNVMKGTSDLLIEATSGEFYNNKEWGRSMNEYRANITNYLSSINDHSRGSQLSAFMRKFAHLYEDHSEGALKSETASAYGKIKNSADALGYLFMTSGEHFLQMTSLIAIAKSHRIVNGVMMSRNEYIANRKEQVVRPLLSPKETKELDDFIEKQSSRDNQNYKPTDHIQKWLTYNFDKLSKDTHAKIIEAIKKAKADAIAEFESKVEVDGKMQDRYETLYSCYEYNPETGDLTTTERVTSQIEASLARRVQGLNHSIHGVYNTIDRNALQNTMFGEVLFQFRKWMYPTWVKYMGSNFKMNPLNKDDRSTFNERLGTYNSGAFADFSRFMRTPLVSQMYHMKENKEAIKSASDAVRAFVNLFKGYAEFFKNISYYYNILSEHEKANVKRTLAFAGVMMGLSAMVFAIGLGYDPKDKEAQKPGNVYNWMVYNTAQWQTEYTDMIPYLGWAKFYQRTKQNIFPMEKQLQTVAKLINDVALYSVLRKEGGIYKNGVYKGRSKVAVDIEKLVPVYKQIHKEMYLNQSIGIYNMYNPIFSLLN